MRLALFDLDGVVADPRHRLFDGVPSEDPFYVVQDDVWPQGRAQVNAMARNGWSIGYTGRPESLRVATEEWLVSRHLPTGEIFTQSDSSRLSPPHLMAHLVSRILASGNYDDIVLFEDSVETIVAVAAVAGLNSVYPVTWGHPEKSSKMVAYL